MAVERSFLRLSGAPPRRPLRDRPGIRVFDSARFRMVLAAVLWIAGAAILALLLARQAADPSGQYGFDFDAYQQAAVALSEGRSPYDPGMLNAPIAAQGEVLYKYPPPFAQSLIPFADLPLLTATTVWLVAQGALMFAALWIAGSAGGAAPSRERFLWTGVAATLFLPVFDTLWKGNVSAVQAFQVALIASGGVVAGSSLATAILLKTTPITLLPAVAVSDRRAVRALLVVAAGLAASSVVLAPGAWADFARVVPNLLTGVSTYATNLAPASLVTVHLPGIQAAGLVRLATVAAGIGAVALSIVVARRPGGRPAAVTLGTAAMLILPAAIWYHYLAVLLPLAALAWPRATPRARVVLVAGAGMVTVGIAALPLATAGAVLLVGATLAATWPSAVRRAAHAQVRSPVGVTGPVGS